MPPGLRAHTARLGDLNRNAKLYLLAVLLSGLSSSIYALFFNLYVDGRGLSRAFLGTLRALPPLLSILLALPAGVLSDRIGRKRALLLSRTGSTAALILFVLAPSPHLMLLAHLLRGLCQALYVVTAAAFMVESSTATERTTLFSASYGLATLAGFLGNLGGGYLPDLFSGAFGLGSRVQAYWATLWGAAGLELLAVLPLLFLTPGGQALLDRPRIKLKELRGHLGFLSRFLLTILIGFTGASLVIPYFNLFFRDRFGFDDPTLGWVFAVSRGITGVIITLAPLLSDRWGRIRSMTITGLLSIPLLLVIGFVPLPAIAVGAFWLRAGLMRIGNPLYDSFYLEHFPAAQRATASSLQQMVCNSGLALGSWLSGQLQEQPPGWALGQLLSCRLLPADDCPITYRPAYGMLFVLTVLLYTGFLLLVYRFFAREDTLPASCASGDDAPPRDRD